MGEKKVKGRKRHIVVDTQGHLLHIMVHAANIHDTKAGGDVFERVKEKFPSLKGFSADAGYQGTSVDHVYPSPLKVLEIFSEISYNYVHYKKELLLSLL